MFYESADQRHISALREHLAHEHGEQAADRAGTLFSLILGDAHRRRLLGVSPAPSLQEAGAIAMETLQRTILPCPLPHEDAGL